MLAAASGCGGSGSARCGDGVVDDGEACDFGSNEGEYGGCLADCSALAARCGDGVVDGDAGEICDDGVNDYLDGGCLPGCKVVDDTAALFATPLLEVAIDMPPADWDALRLQYKSRHTIFGTADCRNRQIENPYDYFAGDVTIGGELISRVGVRKKGHLGSQSTIKPSLKLKLGEFVPAQRYLGAERLALNNSKSDPAYVRTCLSYRVFRDAGIPAPRCTYAHLAVNGQDLGIFVATEEIKDRFLRRHFADARGNLYEGTACDFRPEFFGGFEQETNERQDSSRDDLQAVHDVVQGTPDERFESELAALFDLGQLYRFWAVESLIWHRDGYSGNANNYFLYADPGDGGRFRFLPWGPDAAFRPDNRGNVPDSVLAFGAITHRLYAIPASRERFYQVLTEMLDEVWDAEALIAEVERVAQVIGPRLPAGEQDGFAAAVQSIETTIAGRRGVIESVIAEAFPDWTTGMRSLPCRAPITAVSGTFTTTWDTLSQNVFSAGSATLTVTLDGAPVIFDAIGARAGTTGGGVDRLQIIGDTPDRRRFIITTNFPDPRFFDPFVTVGSHDLRSPPVAMNVTEQDRSVTPVKTLRRFDIGEGSFTFEQASDQPGAALVGSFQGMLYQLP